MQDSRRYTRFTLKVLEVTGKIIFASEVEVVDISIGGISIKANRRLNIGGEYVLKLEDRQRAISLKGTVVWSSLGETKQGRHGEVIPIYKAGLKFLNISVEKITELLNFIEDHKKEEVYVIGSSRLNIRFHVDDEKKTLLDYPASYKAKKISLGGMLIECVLPLEIGSTIPMELFLHNDNIIKFVGRVASCLVLEDGGQKLYDVGIEYLGLTDKDKDVLKSFVNYCAAIEAKSKAD
ncbi:MAG TPA: PilZ domain-containing protein [Syntrophales bacterium]|nr:PilZ domain-containing protein [Syntrophales bacterium]